MQRRSFLKTAALSTFGLTALSSLGFAETKKRIPISVQLYSVRKLAAEDLAGTLSAIAKMGYDGVEFAGYYGKDPKDIRKMLDDNGLKCSGTHTGYGEFTDEKFDRTVEIHKILGTKFMLIPWINPSELKTVDAIKTWADRINGYAEKAKAADVFIGYHAHGGDAQKVDGVEAWQRLFENLKPEVIMQMDLGNYQAGGGDPYKNIELFPGRSKTVHLKEDGKGIIGTGKVDWKRAFELCETIGGTEWYVVEDEFAPDSLDRIDQCVKALKEMGK